MGLVVAPRQLLAGRQQVLEVTAPRGRVLAGAVALGLGRVQHSLDASSKAPRRLRHRLPERFQDLEHVLDRDLVHGHGAQRPGVLLERHPPLRPVLVVAPLAFHGRKVLVSHLAEGRHAHGLGRLAIALVERIEAGHDLPPGLLGESPGRGERHAVGLLGRTKGPEPHLASLADEHRRLALALGAMDRAPVDEQPRLGPGAPHVEEEPAAIGIAPRRHQGRRRLHCQNIE